MAIFNSGSGQTNVSAATTIIAYGTSIKGDIQLKCNLHIDGKIEGSIQTAGNVVIGKSGVVNGDIRAVNASISGRFEGSLEAESVELLEGGKLFGKVTAKGFVIEPSAIFEGESRLKTEHAQAGDNESVGLATARLEKKDTKLTAI